MKGIPYGSGKKSEVAGLPAGPVNHPEICTGSLGYAMVGLLHTCDGTTGCTGSGVV